MGIKVFAGTYGVAIIGLFVVLLVGSLCFAIYIYILRRRHGALKKPFNPHEYTIIEQNPDGVIKIKQNPIQPPAQVKVKLVPTSPTRLAPTPTQKHKQPHKKMIRYSEIDDNDADEERKEGRTNFRISIRNYKQKLLELLDPDKVTVAEEEIAPCVVAIENESDNDSIDRALRLRRSDSGIPNEATLGQIVFLLEYSSSEEFLTVNLLSGRQIHSSDSEYAVNLPVVSIQLQGCPDTEVTSAPDEAPNPEYDQEFTFDGMSMDKLQTTVLLFIVWDVISPHGHETKVVGFFHVSLAHFHNTLVEDGESGPIRRDINTYLCEDKKDFAGEVLLSLMYDCVTDRIIVTVRKVKGINIEYDDVDIYIKISLLLDNDVIQSKRSLSFTSASTININQTFEFNALSADLELLANTTEFPKATLELKDKESEIKSTSSETLKHNMGILCSVRASTVNKVERVVGRLHLGRTNTGGSDEEFHWEEMIRHFDNTITQWHILKLNY